MPNFNPETGIAYGVIACNTINSDLMDDLWYTHGTDLSYKAACEEERANLCRELEDEWEGEMDEADFEDELEARLESACEHFQIEEPTIEGECDGVQYHISWLGGAPLLWVFDSKYVGHYARCSPCVPGAGNLDEPAEDGVLCYDVPKTWRREC